MDNELKEILEMISFKLDRNSEKIDNLDLRLRVAESNIIKDIKVLKDENELSLRF